MQAKQLEKANEYLIRLDAGDDVVASLKDFIARGNIGHTQFSCIGACGEAVLSYYDLTNKKYVDVHLVENMEIVSLQGNAAWMDDEVIMHAHGVLGRSDYTCVSGHVKRLIVSATSEVFLQTYREKSIRLPDETTGLNLLHID